MASFLPNSVSAGDLRPTLEKETIVTSIGCIGILSNLEIECGDPYVKGIPQRRG